jgi:phosphonate transport system permease protein
MPVLVQSGERVWKRRTSREEWVRYGVLLGVGVVLLAAWASISAVTSWEFVADSPIQLRDLLDRMTPPDAAYARELARPLLDTLHIATLGTVLGVLLALPISFAAALPTTPSRSFVRPLALLLLVASRSVNAIIWALMLVVLLGPGMFSGILAIALRSVGFVGKLVYEAIEEAPLLPVSAIETTGAGRMQALAYGLLPNVLPAIAGVSVYRWEINIREATILGLVGAGGIGMALQASIDALAWSRVSLILLAILGSVVVAEWVSAKVRGGLR